ncbi:MAG: hypothetical protein KIT80_02240 [Chitinophagaceae bacterium]|nr:hypothetical protein [Chitinophagaceae bacterium]MCW5925705.1 hypothetical protein [Chitinophagaceae bacterium]
MNYHYAKVGIVSTGIGWDHSTFSISLFIFADTPQLFCKQHKKSFFPPKKVLAAAGIFFLWL